MMETGETTTGSVPADPDRLFEDAFNHLSLGIVILNGRREVVFCNARYREIYGLSAERVKPGSPTRGSSFPLGNG